MENISILHWLQQPDLEDIIRQYQAYPAERLPYLLSQKYPQQPVAPLCEWIINLTKASNKLPTFTQHHCLIPSLSLQQTTNEAVANARSYFDGETALDLTGGLGTDTFYLAKHFREVHFVEQNPALCLLAKYNFERLGLENIHIHNTTAEKWLNQNSSKHFDLVFLDPSRRTVDDRRISDPDQGSPPLSPLLPVIKKITQRLWIKTAPLFDFQEAIRRWDNIQTIGFYSLKGEMREILYDFNFTNDESNNPLILKKLCALHADGSIYTQEYQVNDEINMYHAPDFCKENYRYLLDLDVVFHASRSVRSFFVAFFESSHSYLPVNNSFIFTDQIPESYAGRIFKIIDIDKADTMIRKVIAQKIPRISILARSVSSKEVAKVEKKLRLPESGQLFIILCYIRSNDLYAVLAERNI